MYAFTCYPECPVSSLNQCLKGHVWALKPLKLSRYKWHAAGIPSPGATTPQRRRGLQFSASIARKTVLEASCIHNYAFSASDLVGIAGEKIKDSMWSYHSVFYLTSRLYPTCSVLRWATFRGVCQNVCFWVELIISLKPRKVHSMDAGSSQPTTLRTSGRRLLKLFSWHVYPGFMGIRLTFVEYSAIVNHVSGLEMQRQKGWIVLKNTPPPPRKNRCRPYQLEFVQGGCAVLHSGCSTA